MPSRLPTRSQKCRETRPYRAALLTRLSGRSRLLRNDPSTISSPAPAAADPDKPGRPRSDRQPTTTHPEALTRDGVQISPGARGAIGNPTTTHPEALTRDGVQISPGARGAIGNPTTTHPEALTRDGVQISDIVAS